MGKIITVVNQKGGVGKTTTCVSLTAALREMGRKVLLCDFDPQANATSGMGVDKSLSLGIYDVLLNEVEPEKRVVPTRYGDVLPSSKGLAGAGVEMVGIQDREHLLRRALEKLAPKYDYIFVDCPPSLELLTLNGLCAADSALVPVQSEYFALEGLSDLMYTIRAVRKSLNPHLELEGVLLTMYDSRTNLALQVSEEVKRFFPGKVYSTVIPRNVRLSEAPSHGVPVSVYDPLSRGAEAYETLAMGSPSAPTTGPAGAARRTPPWRRSFCVRIRSKRKEEFPCGKGKRNGQGPQRPVGRGLFRRFFHTVLHPAGFPDRELPESAEKEL